MKKALFIALLKIFLLTGCARTTDTDIKQSVRELSLYLGNPGLPHHGIQNTTVGIRITQKTGVAVKTVYPESNDPEAEAKRISQGDNRPDIIYGEIRHFIRENTLIPLDDLIDEFGPNIKKYYGNLLNLFKDENGILWYIGENYQLPSHYFPPRAFWMNRKLLKEHKWPELKEIEDYFSHIRRYLTENKNSDLIGFTAMFAPIDKNTLLPAAALLMGYPDNGDVYIKDSSNYETDLVVRSWGAYRYFKILNALWHEGILDKELFTQNWNSYSKKILSGKVLGFSGKDHQTPTLSEKIEEMQNITDRTPIKFQDRFHIPFPVLFEGVKNDYYFTLPDIPVNRGTGISIYCTEPEEVVNYWNRLLEDDIQKLIYWGVEKNNYYLVNGKMKKGLTDLRNLFSPTDGIFQFIIGFPQRNQFSTYQDGNPLTPLQTPEYLAFDATVRVRETLKQYNIETFQTLFSPPTKILHGMGYTPNPQPDHPAYSIKKNIDRLTLEYIEKCIISDNFEDLWQEFREKLSEIPVSIYLDYVSSYFRQRERKLL